MTRSIDILLVEDNPADVRLTLEAFKDGRILNRITVATDGEEALAVLRRSGTHSDAVRPDIVLLDLNLPKIDGREVLQQIKENADLRRIPVVVLTTSADEQDVLRMYDLHANCYITKPVEFERFLDVVRTIEDFWLSVVRLPTDTE